MTDKDFPKLETLSFGIGCYSFEAPDADHLTMQNPDGTYTIHAWADDVLGALQRIPSLDDIQVQGFRSVRGDHSLGWRNQVEQALRDMPRGSYHRGGDLTPHPVVGRISFAVTIPVHVQERLGRRFGPITGTRFTVDIHYGYGMPVAFVRAPEGSWSPSTAVAMVREFLREEFEQRIPDGPIMFTCMGPSPMWNDCFVSLRSRLSLTPADVELEDTPGYMTIRFSVRETDEITNVVDAFHYVQDVTAEELSLYYEVISRRNLLSLQLGVIEESLESLVARNRAPGVIGWWRRMVGGGRAANELMLQILGASAETRRLLGQLASDWEDIRSRSPLNAFDKQFERELARDTEQHHDHARDVVSLLNERHSKDVQVVSVLGASVLGGIAGAALTGLAQALSA